MQRLAATPLKALTSSSRSSSRDGLTLGRNFEALDPLEWLARMSDHIPDPGQHRTILYGVHREFNFACPAAVHGDGGVGSLIGDRLRVVAVLGLVKRDDGEA
jgi:hypothetical protein